MLVDIQFLLLGLQVNAKECNIESYTDCRDIVIPGKLAVIKPDVADNMPGWNVVVGPLESMELPKFLKEYAANH